MVARKPDVPVFQDEELPDLQCPHFLDLGFALQHAVDRRARDADAFASKLENTLRPEDRFLSAGIDESLHTEFAAAHENRWRIRLEIFDGTLTGTLDIAGGMLTGTFKATKK